VLTFHGVFRALLAIFGSSAERKAIFLKVTSDTNDSMSIASLLSISTMDHSGEELADQEGEYP
jgi:hypothetical protein